MKHAYLYLVAGLAVATAAWGVIHYHNPAGQQTTTQKPKPAPTVVTVLAAKADIVREIALDGSVEATRVARIASPAEGVIGNCRLREGDQVKKGQQVLCIGRRESVEARLAAARQDLAAEQAELDRVKKLVDEGVLPGNRMDIARALFENANAQLIELQQSNEDYHLFAPWDGVISRVLVLEGDYVAPRTPLMEIIDMDSLTVRFAVPEVHAQAVHLGKEIEVTLDGYPGREFKATISRVYPRLDPILRTRITEAVLEGDVALLPGMFARLMLEVARVDDATVVPTEAVLTSAEGQQRVFVVEDGKAKRQPVVTGIEADGRIQIVQGLAPGAMVAIAGHEGLKDGVAIKVAAPKEPPAGAPASKAGG